MEGMPARDIDKADTEYRSYNDFSRQFSHRFRLVYDFLYFWLSLFLSEIRQSRQLLLFHLSEALPLEASVKI